MPKPEHVKKTSDELTISQHEPGESAHESFARWWTSTQADDTQLSPADKEIYQRVWSLYDEMDVCDAEREKWEKMEHKNDPTKEKEIREELKKIDAKVSKLNNDIEKATGNNLPQVAKGITKQQVLAAFEQLVKVDLAGLLADNLGMYQEAQTRRGRRGRSSHLALWNPVILAVGFREKYLVPKLHLNQAFFKYDFLAEWRDEWDEVVKGLPG